MARGGGSRGGAPSGRRPLKKGVAAKTDAKRADAAKRRPSPPAPAAPPPDATPRTFTLGAVPGTSPGTWIQKWRERLPHIELVLRSIPAADQLRILRAGEVDAALVRLPVGDEGLHVITLYEETSVVVVPADSHLTAADELDVTDLAGEVVIVPGDDVLGLEIAGTVAPSFEPPADTVDAVATVATGVGVVIVPFSLARLHARKDVEHRPLRGVGSSGVGLAWPSERTTPDIDTFVGIVRGRTAHSSR